MKERVILILILVLIFGVFPNLVIAGPCYDGCSDKWFVDCGGSCDSTDCRNSCTDNYHVCTRQCDADYAASQGSSGSSGSTGYTAPAQDNNWEQDLKDAAKKRDAGILAEEKATYAKDVESWFQDMADYYPGVEANQLKEELVSCPKEVVETISDVLIGYAKGNPNYFLSKFYADTFQTFRLKVASDKSITCYQLVDKNTEKIPLTSWQKSAKDLEEQKRLSDELIQETSETGGTLGEWKIKVLDLAGEDSASYKSIIECEQAMQAQVLSCSGSDGWMVDNAINIGVSNLPIKYEYENIVARNGCYQNMSKRVLVDTKNFDSSAKSSTESLQVTCQINCYNWETCQADTKVYNGKVEVEQDGIVKNLSADLKIKKGDVIRTDSKATVAVKHGSVNLQIGPGSSVEVEELNSFLLKDGKLWGYVGKLIKGEIVTIKTPVAVHEIKGTEFIVVFDANTNISTLHLQSGNITSLLFGKESKDIVAGQTLMTSANETIYISPLSISQEDWSALIKDVVYKTGDSSGQKSIQGFKLIIFYLGMLIISLVIFRVSILIIRKYTGKKTKIWSVGSLVLGILGILISPAAFFGLAISTTAINFYQEQKKIKPTSLAKAGLVLGIIGLIINSVFFIFLIILA